MAAAVSTRTKSLSDPVDAIMERSSTSLLDVAFVYDKDSNSCGHKVSLISLVGDRIRQSTQHGPATCPVCKLPIAMVRDQAALDPASQTVSFKYGKLTYELSLPDEASESKIKSSTLWFLPFASTKKTPNTVQARIAHALGLNMSDMKILHKGKVLYPSISASTSEQDVSDLLFQHHEPLHGKPQLLVMGTVEAYQLPKQAPNRGDLWNQLMGLSQSIVVSTLNFTVSILVNILQGVASFAIPLLKRNGEPSQVSSRRND